MAKIRPMLGVGRDVVGAVLALGRQVEQLGRHAELRVREHDLLERVVGGAADQHDASPDRPVRVLKRPQGRPGVGAPCAPVQERLGRARRVVGERVEEGVQHLEAASEPRRDHREVRARAAQVANRRLYVTGEGADLVADDRRGLAEERARLAQRRSQLAGERPEPLQRGTELVGQRARLLQRRLGLRQRTRELAQGRPQRTLLRGERLEVRVRRVDQRRELAVTPGERGREQLEIVDDPLDVVAALDQEPREPLAVARGGLEALERLAEVLLGRLPKAARGAARLVVECRSAGVQQDAQIVARVGVELGEDLVHVHVRERVRHPHAAALGQVAGLGGSGVEREEHVLQPGLRPQQDGGVAMDRLVLVLDLHHDDGAPVLELHLADLADLDARDVHRLPLPRDDRLPGGQLGLDLIEVGADHGDPRRQVETLVREDVAGDPERPHEKEQQRHEDAHLLPDLPPHGPAPIGAALRSGGVCL
jgi:hypothetical protein